MGSASGKGKVDAVLVGGSAGALEVLLQILPHLSPDFGVPVVVVVHVPPHGPHLLARLLDARCQLSVTEAEDGEPLLSPHVYVAPANYHLLLEGGPIFALSVDGPVNFSVPSIDVLFESAAQLLGPRVVGVMLTGANHDGAQGLRAIQQAGGVALVQTPRTALAPTMPLAALRACPEASVLSLSQMRQCLANLTVSTH